MDIGILYRLILIIVVMLLANLPYKGRLFDKFNPKLFLLCLTSFVTGTIILVFFSKNYILIKTGVFSSLIFILTTVLWFISPHLIRKFGRYPTNYLQKHGNKTRFLARFDLHSMAIKFFEILFQQSMFLFLLFYALSFDNTPWKILIFTFLMIFIHLLNMPFLGFKWTLTYTALSIPMAIVFGWLILNGHILITFSIHLLFYLIFNGQLWFFKNNTTSSNS